MMLKSLLCVLSVWWCVPCYSMDYQGKGKMIVAIECGDMCAVEQLAQYQNVRWLFEPGDMPLEYAIKQGKIEIAVYLLAHPQTSCPGHKELFALARPLRNRELNRAIAERGVLQLKSSEAPWNVTAEQILRACNING